MTREKFIKKWLSNKDYQYTEQNRDLMRNDLDKVINQALRQPLVSSSVCHCNNLHDGEIAINSKALQKPYGDLGQTDC
jgi:hypothetical protein